MQDVKWKINKNNDLDFCIDDDKAMLKMQTFLKSGHLCECITLSQCDMDLLHKLITEGINLNLSLIMSIYYCQYAVSHFLINNGAIMYDVYDKKITAFSDMTDISPIAIISKALNTLRI